MQTIETVPEMRAAAAQARGAGRPIALVVTAGALHAGHQALVAAARGRSQFVVLTCFPNPWAFGPGENFGRYPRDPEGDRSQAADWQAAVLFSPPTEEIFPRGFSTFVEEEAVSKPLCGVSRPAHFRGVTTLMAKLLNVIGPAWLVLGQRDAQQAAVVQKMISDLAFGTEVLVVPAVREPDGLVLAVRNRDLSAGQRQEALALPAARERAIQMVAQGVRSPDRIIAEATHLLGERRRVRLIYVAIVDPVTMEPLREVVPGRTLLAIAAWVDEVRLVENVLL